MQSLRWGFLLILQSNRLKLLAFRILQNCQKREGNVWCRYIDLFLIQYWDLTKRNWRLCEGAKYPKLHTYINQPIFFDTIRHLLPSGFHNMHLLPFQIKTKTLQMKFVDVVLNRAFQNNLKTKQILTQSHILFVKTSKKIFAFSCWC